MSLHLTVFVIGAAGGLLAGLLSAGSAVILLPLLTIFAGLTLKQAAGLTVVQVVASAATTVLVYRGGRLVHTRLALHMGIAAAVGGLLGGLGSGAISREVLHALYVGLMLAGLALLFHPVSARPLATGDLPGFRRAVAIVLGAAIGALAGLLGAGGGFITVPLMVGALGLPPHVAVGSSPIVSLASSLFGMAGKLLANQIQLDLAIALVLGAVPAAYAASHLGRRLPGPALRLGFGLLLAVLTVQGMIQLIYSPR